MDPAVKAERGQLLAAFHQLVTPQGIFARTFTYAAIAGTCCCSEWSAIGDGKGEDQCDCYESERPKPSFTLPDCKL